MTSKLDATLKILSTCNNSSIHPSDKDRIIDYLTVLKKQTGALNPTVIDQWLDTNSWMPNAKKEFLGIVEKINQGKSPRRSGFSPKSNPKTIWNNIVDTSKETP